MANEETEPQFSKDEDVLCFEPDSSKVKVLWDAKILSVDKVKDRSGQYVTGYKIHFKGWSSKWDRTVRAHCLLKDTEENRVLQQELYTSSQISKRKRGGKNTPAEIDSLIQPSTSTAAATTATETMSSSRSSTNVNSVAKRFTAAAASVMPKTPTSNKKSRNKRKETSAPRVDENNSAASDSHISYEKSSIAHDPDRVVFRISERLRRFLDYDKLMIVTHSKRHKLPARVSVLKLMEDFVKQRAVELVVNMKTGGTKSRMGLNPDEYARIVATVNILKEVVDGVRIYLNCLIYISLLYNKERDHTMPYLSQDFLRQFKSEMVDDDPIPYRKRDKENRIRPTINCQGYDIVTQDNYKRQLWYYMDKIGKITKKPIPLHKQEAAQNLIPEMVTFLQEVFKWKMFPEGSAPDKSMVLGPVHLARVFLKLPKYLSLSDMTEEHLLILLPHLDSFINYVESHEEWFSEQNYEDDIVLTIKTEPGAELDPNGQTEYQLSATGHQPTEPEFMEHSHFHINHICDPGMNNLHSQRSELKLADYKKQRIEEENHEQQSQNRDLWNTNM